MRTAALQCLEAILQPHVQGVSVYHNGAPSGAEGSPSAHDPLLTHAMAPFIAYLASLFLKVAEAESAAGGDGSLHAVMQAHVCCSEGSCPA